MSKGLPLPILLLVAACSPQADDAGAPTPAANVVSKRSTKALPTAPGPDPRVDRLKAWAKTAYADMGTLMLKWGAADLDADGKDEVLAYVGGPMMCGTGGCPLSILRDDGNRFELISRTSVNQLPLGVLDTWTGGMRDIWVTVSGGGMPEQTRRLKWNGRRYPFNPTVAPAERIQTPGKVVIAEGQLETID